MSGPFGPDAGNFTRSKVDLPATGPLFFSFFKYFSILPVLFDFHTV